MLVVVLDEFVEESAKLALVPYEGAVERFVAYGADPLFGERVWVWSAGWDGEDCVADSGEDVVE